MENELKVQLSGLLHEIIHENKAIVNQGDYRNLLSLCERDITIISMLYEESGMTAKQISDRLDTPKTTIVTAVSRLVKRDYLRRIQNEQDRREMLLELTEKGITAHREHVGFENIFLDYLIGRWNEEDQKKLAELLKRRSDIV